MYSIGLITKIRELKFHANFDVENESSQGRKFLGTNDPGNKSSKERKFHRWNFRSQERRFSGTKVPVTILTINLVII